MSGHRHGIHIQNRAPALWQPPEAQPESGERNVPRSIVNRRRAKNRRARQARKRNRR